MGEILPFPSRRKAAAGAARARSPQTVFEDRGWRILEVPQIGKFLAISGYCRRGVEVGRFHPEAPAANHHDGTEIAILTRCAADERLSRCAIAWLNAGGPRIAVLGSFVVAAGGRYHFWRDATIEVAVIGGEKLARLLDGSIAIAREPEPIPLLDPFAAVRAKRRRPAFDRLAPEMRVAVLRWADPMGQFGALLGPPRAH